VGIAAAEEAVATWTAISLLMDLVAAAAAVMAAAAAVVVAVPEEILMAVPEEPVGTRV
jgi:hypothetical protein